MSTVLDLLNPFKDVVGVVHDILDHFVTDPTKKLEVQSALDQAQIALSEKAMELDAQLADAQQKVIVAEAQGSSWAQRNWRPFTMFAFVAILVNNFILAPYLKSFGLNVPLLAIPAEMWALLTVGIGGYIGARSYEKKQGVA